MKVWKGAWNEKMFKPHGARARFPLVLMQKGWFLPKLLQFVHYELLRAMRYIFEFLLYQTLYEIGSVGMLVSNERVNTFCPNFCSRFKSKWERRLHVWKSEKVCNKKVCDWYSLIIYNWISHKIFPFLHDTFV